MRRGGWTLRSSLWFVLLVALGLRVATSTWSNWQRGSVGYHQGLADRCDDVSTRHQRWATRLENESIEKLLFDPAAAAADLDMAMWLDADAQASSLLAASLAAKAELCKESRVGWIFVLYETARNPPDVPTRRVAVSAHGGQPWPGIALLAPLEATLAPLIATLAQVDYPGLACLVAAIVLRWSLFPPRRVEDDPARPVASTPGTQ